VTNKLDEARKLVARANRMIANEGVLDAFGHVTMRHPTDPKRYLMSRSRAPELVQPDDILEFTLDSQPVKPTDVRLYGERVIHGGIYLARPDVNAVCHHHAPSILPFCISGMDLKPVYHLGATLGENVPFWDARDEFGDTTLIVAKPEEGASLARALGPSRRDSRRRNSGRTYIPHNLYRAQRRSADPGAQPRLCLTAQRRRDPPCR
jgi:HCOMODA/2-hydroxy-3-carboxy-muconic semialdehyde decarboxylase